MQLVRLWRWKEAEGATGAFESLRAADGPLVPQPGLPSRHCRHERFPRHLYGSTWRLSLRAPAGASRGVSSRALP